jgi:hypothetical protein
LLFDVHGPMMWTRDGPEQGKQPLRERCQNRRLVCSNGHQADLPSPFGASVPPHRVCVSVRPSVQRHYLGTIQIFGHSPADGSPTWLSISKGNINNYSKRKHVRCRQTSSMAWLSRGQASLAETLQLPSQPLMHPPPYVSAS